MQERLTLTAIPLTEKKIKICLSTVSCLKNIIYLIRYKSLSLWKYKELPIGMITSITFTLLNEKTFSFDSTSSTTNLQTWQPTLRIPFYFESNCHQSSFLVRSPSNSLFYRSPRVSNKANENLLPISLLYNDN